MFIVKDIARLSETYLAHRNWSSATLGSYAVGDSRFFQRLENGRVTLLQCARLGAWLEQNWPKELEWPLPHLRCGEFSKALPAQASIADETPPPPLVAPQPHNPKE